MLLDATGNSTLHMHEHGDGSTTIVESTDVTAALEYNAALRSAGVTKTKDGDNFYVKTPISVLNSWSLHKYGVTWDVIANDDKKFDEFVSEHSAVQIGGN